MFARVSTFKGSGDELDDAAVAEYRRITEERALPVAREMGGFRGLLSLVDRSTGNGLAITLWESEQAMLASEDAANKLREEATTETGDEIARVERYEVALDAREES